MKISDAKLTHLHEELIRRFKSVLNGQKASLNFEYNLEPKSVRKGDKLECGLVFNGEHGVERLPRKRGPKQSVMRLPTRFDGLSTPAAWVGWYEVWKRQSVDKGGTFDLIGASMTFYWGYINRERTELLRAELDTEHRGGGLTAAQPHWHMDSEFALPFADSVRAHLAEVLGNGGGLEELAAEETGALVEMGRQPEKLSLSPMHFGMGGWAHGTSTPACWQFKFKDNDIMSFAQWAQFTLEYVIQEFERLKLEKVPPPER